MESSSLRSVLENGMSSGVLTKSIVESIMFMICLIVAWVIVKGVFGRAEDESDELSSYHFKKNK